MNRTNIVQRLFINNDIVKNLKCSHEEFLFRVTGIIAHGLTQIFRSP